MVLTKKPRNLLRGLGYIELVFKLIQNMPRNQYSHPSD